VQVEDDGLSDIELRDIAFRSSVLRDGTGVGIDRFSRQKTVQTNVLSIMHKTKEGTVKAEELMPSNQVRKGILPSVFRDLGQDLKFMSQQHSVTGFKTS